MRSSAAPPAIPDEIHNRLWKEAGRSTHHLSRPTMILRPRPHPHLLLKGSRAAFAAAGRDLSAAAGAIHVILGPMFAGKTTALLRRIRSETSNGRRVALVKSDKDTRYGSEAAVTTHDGSRMPCWALPQLSQLRAKLGDAAYDKLDVIGIDEAQFFEDLYEFCRNAADHDGKTVVVAGLDGDYLRRSFGSVVDLIPLADSVTKLTARCKLCGERALFTLRKTGDKQTELIGGSDVYMPVCRKHYLDGQIVIGAAKIVMESGKMVSNF